MQRHAAGAGAVLRFFLSRRRSQACLNSVYNFLPYWQKRVAHWALAKIYRETACPLAERDWTIEFAGKTVRIPLRNESAWLDWDIAVSTLGHETEIIGTYEALIGSKRRPSLFFDVGGNYGTHSLLFLVHKIKTVTFEPNPLCHAYFENLCEYNAVRCHIEPIGLDERTGTADLWFPRGETWLGSLQQAGIRAARDILVRIPVPTARLDDYVRSNGLAPSLIKVDTEGTERRVIAGMQSTLREHRPWVIFESWRNSNRSELLSLFRDVRYSICSLPITAGRRVSLIGGQEFFAHRMQNFAALPDEDGKAQL